MESSACRRRASDAEQSAWSYSVPVEYMPVKEEPEWGECGVSEAAVAEGLYAGHRVKDELAIGPELMQQQDIAFSMQNASSRMEEGPCKVKLESGAGTTPKCTHTSPRDKPCCYRSSEQQYGLRSCFVRLERLLVEDLQRSKPFHISRNYMLSRAEEDACRLKSAEEAGPATESTRTQSYLTTSKQMHTGQKPHSCDICLKWFTQRRQLTQHIRIHTDEKPHSCNICQKHFKRRDQLARHIKIHSDEKPYSCDICSKRFRQSYYLRRHIRYHTAEKRHSCDICSKRFKSKQDLNSHIRVHTNEKSYSCDICNKLFKHKISIIYHLRVHTGEKPYKCDTCNALFRHTSTLASHMRIHTGEKPYTCDICNQRFRFKCSLTGHRQTHTIREFVRHTTSSNSGPVYKSTLCSGLRKLHTTMDAP